MRRAFLLVLVLFVCTPALGGKAKRAKKAKVPPQAALSNTLNEKRDDIQSCAIRHALERGATRVDIQTRVTINRTGQVMDSRTSVTVTGGDGEQVRACVDEIIKKIRFPTTDAPLITIERAWTVAAQ